MSIPYCYAPLDEHAKQIRILTLLPDNSPARHDPEIRISLEIIQLSEENPPEFEALSYTWGSSENPVDIVIETESGIQVLAITQNLAEALRHLRHENQSRVLWIDAICIDQGNLSERSSQVRRMADLFRLSKRVVVWLGPERDNSSLALQLLESLGTKVEVNWENYTMKALSQDASE